MRKSISYTLFIFLLLNICYSCEKQVVIDVEIAEPRLVMRAEITNAPEWVAGGPGITLPSIIPSKLTMGMSSSVYDKPLDSLTNCKILLKKNNTIFDTIFYDHSKEYYNLFENEEDYPIAGDELEIKVFYGNQFVSSKSQMPDNVPIKSIDTSSVYSIFIKEGRLYGSSSMTFDDPVNVDNYYELIVSYSGMRSIRTDESFIKGESHYSSDFNTVGSPSVTESLLFTDKTFNGEEKTVNFYFEMGAYMHESSVDFQHTVIAYHLRNVSKDYYVFQTSRRNHLITNNVNLLFGAAEPQNVISNVKDGLGLFGLYNHDQKNYFFPARTITF